MIIETAMTGSAGANYLDEDTNLGDMSWDEVGKLLKKTDTVLIPVGSMEQHGTHLPLGTDTYIATEIARRVSEKIGVAFTSGIPYGFSIEHFNFLGTITLTPESLMGVMRDVCEGMVRHGFKKIILINGHGGNASILETLIQSLKAKHKATFALINITDMAACYLQQSRGLRPSVVTHADELETSLLLAIDKTKVKLNKIKNSKRSARSGLKTPVGVKVAWQTEEYSSTGSIGELRRMGRAEGKRILTYILENILEFLDGS
jgi:creatinine amidohydrolase